MGFIIQGDGFAAVTGGGGAGDEGPVHFWKMNGGATTHSFANHGTSDRPLEYAVGDHFTYNVDGATGDGDKAVDVPLSSSVGSRYRAAGIRVPAEYTVSMFIKMHNTSALCVAAIDGDDAVARSFQFYCSWPTPNKIGLAFATGAGFSFPQSSTGDITVGEWTHVAFTVGTYNSGANTTPVTFYIGGEDCGTVNVSGSVVPNPSPTSYFDLGSSGWDERNWRGSIDEVAIFDRALSLSEIRTCAGL